MVNERNYTTTVKCITAVGSLYTAKADKFINSISKDDRAWKIILEMNVTKDKETKYKIKNAALSLKTKFNDSSVHEAASPQKNQLDDMKDQLSQAS